MLRIRLLVLMSGAFAISSTLSSCPAGAVEVAPSVEVNCVMLRNAVYAGAIPGHPLSGHYACTVEDDPSILALRYKGPEVEDNTSNLVGYYKVSFSTGEIHEWNLGDLRAGNLIFAPNAKQGDPK